MALLFIDDASQDKGESNMKNDPAVQNRLCECSATFHLQEPIKNFACDGIWLDTNHEKMSIVLTGKRNLRFLTVVARELKKKRINIECGENLKLKQSSGAYFEISGPAQGLHDLYTDLQNSLTRSVPLEDSEYQGSLYELEIEAPDRSGILCDIDEPARNENIGIEHLIIETTAGPNRKGIVNAQIRVPSKQALENFLGRLKDAEGYLDWKVKLTLLEEGSGTEQLPLSHSDN